MNWVLYEEMKKKRIAKLDRQLLKKQERERERKRKEQVVFT